MSVRSSAAALAVLVSFALTPVARADLKMGYVDLQRALGEVEEGRSAKSRLQGLLEVKQKDLDKEQEGLRKEKELLDKSPPDDEQAARAKSHRHKKVTADKWNQ